MKLGQTVLERTITAHVTHRTFTKYAVETGICKNPRISKDIRFRCAHWYIILVSSSGAQCSIVEVGMQQTTKQPSSLHESGHFEICLRHLKGNVPDRNETKHQTIIIES